MKYNNKLSSLLLTALMMTAGLSMQSCKDQPDEFELTDGTPTINYIRPVPVPKTRCSSRPIPRPISASSVLT